MLRLLVGISLGLAATCACAGEFNGVLSIGDAAPAWCDLPGADGQQHALSDLKDHKIVVVVFTCNSCPVARDYEDRTSRWPSATTRCGRRRHQRQSRGRDSLAKMAERAKHKQFPSPIFLTNRNRSVATMAPVLRPIIFVLSAERKIVYMGAWTTPATPPR